MEVRTPEELGVRADVPVTFVLEDAESLTANGQGVISVTGCKGHNLLEVALLHGIEVEHSCGGVCACSTCHVYIDEGMDQVCEPTQAEEDRVEEAPGLELNSRLSCQCVIEGDGPIKVRVPAWNRNAVKEAAH